MMLLKCSTKTDRDSDVELKTVITVTDVPEDLDDIIAQHAAKNMVVFFQDKLRRAKGKNGYKASDWEGHIQLPLTWFKPSERGEKTVSKAKIKLAESYGMTVDELESLLASKK